MHKLSFLIIFSIISLNAIGEPIGYNREYKYEKVRILSCETSENIMLKKAEFRSYSSLNKRKLLESAKNLIILDVIPLFEVEYITSVYNGSAQHYLGKVTPLTNQKRNKLHMQWASCEKYQKNKEVIFSISSGYHCMREPVPPAYQETEAACLIEYEIASEAYITGSR